MRVYHRHSSAIDGVPFASQWNPGLPVVGEAISVIAVLVLIASLVDYNAVHEEVRALRPDEYKRSLNIEAMDTFIWNSPLSPEGRRRSMRAMILLCASMGLLALGRFIQG